jgi:pimeloyl-ACP methyl ester carboxylesterase
VDGVSIAYDVRGAGDTALVFVHCWACDRSFWRGQVDTFSGEYRIVTLDLAGHGASGSEREAWTVARLAEDVRAVVESLDIQRVVLVGHSLGGPVSLEATRLMPERVMAVVGVDTLHDVTFEFPEEAAEQMMAGLERDFEKTMRGFISNSLTAPDPAVVDFVLSKAISANREAVLAIASNFSQFVLKEAMAAVKIPIWCINAEANPPMAPETNIAANRDYADFDAVIMGGVGHFLYLDRPEDFNEELRKVLAGLEPSS